MCTFRTIQTICTLIRDLDPIGFNENVNTTAVIGDRFVNVPTAIEPLLFNYLTLTLMTISIYLWSWYWLNLNTLTYCNDLDIIYLVIQYRFHSSLLLEIKANLKSTCLKMNLYLLAVTSLASRVYIFVREIGTEK